ncbi:unannotated protein [freshwater metagenome]|uniref:Unannotated protein n=1 Tax=freshwater metagenome TaxID=449393 RepID=A0A6J5YGS7_9ZZZZ
MTSVVIPSFQGGERLKVLLECLSRQVTDFEWEAIVVLDGSTDDSLDVIRDWAAIIPVRAVDLGVNQGRPTALNAGFSAANGRVLIRCDDDLAPRPQYLSDHTAHHRDTDEVGVIGLYDNIIPQTTYTSAYGAQAHAAFNRSVLATPAQYLWRYWAGNCSVTRTMYDRVGPYDTAFRYYGWEDTDWGYRLALAGASICVDPGLETPHHTPAVTTEIRSRRAFLSGSAATRFLEKHGPVDDPTSIEVAQWTVWTTGVRIASLAPNSIRVAGARFIDRVGHRFPRGITRKLIALSVESSGMAGRRCGPNPPASFGKGV